MSSNYFELLLNNQPAKKAAPKTAAPAAAPKAAKKAAAPAAAAPKAAAPKTAAPVATKAAAPKKEGSKDAKFSNERVTKENTARQGDRKPRAPRPASDFSWKEGDAKPATKIGGETRKERRNFEAKVADAANAPVQKRQFDRRSAHPTGEVKKGGSGKANWGTPGSEAEGEKRERRERRERKPRAPKTETAEGEAKAEEAPAAPRELTPEEIAAKEEAERDAKLLTLKQYKKKLNSEKVKIALKAPRAAEGDWSEFTVLAKEADSEKAAKKTAVAAPAAAAVVADKDALVAQSLAGLKKKEAEKKILSQILKNNVLTQKTAPRRENSGKKEAKNSEFGLVVEEFPSLAPVAVAAAAATESQ